MSRRYKLRRNKVAVHVISTLKELGAEMERSQQQ